MIERILFAVGALAREQQTEWRAIHGLSDDAPLTLNWETLPRWTPEHREAVIVALHDWCFTIEPSEMVAQVTQSSRLVGAWLACEVAKAACANTPDDRPRLGVEWARDRVRGRATIDDCRGARAAVIAFIMRYTPDAQRSEDEAGAAAQSAIECAGYATRANAPMHAKKAVEHAAASFMFLPHAQALGWTESSTPERLQHMIARAVREALDAAEMGYKARAKKEE